MCSSDLPKTKGKVKKASEGKVKKPKPSVKGKIYYLELDIKKLNPSLLKFAEEKGWEVYEKTSEKVYLKKKMRSVSALDDDLWSSRQFSAVLRSSISKKITPDKKEKVIPSAGGKEDDKPKPKTTTKEALQEMPLDIGGKISELQKNPLYKRKGRQRSDEYPDQIKLEGVLGKDKIAEILTRPNREGKLPKNISISLNSKYDSKKGKYVSQRKTIPSSILMYDGGQTISSDESGEDFTIYYDVYEISDEDADKYNLDF